MELAITCLVILLARTAEISIDVVRVVSVMQGKRLVAVTAAFVQNIIWIVVISNILKQSLGPPQMISYALGFALGNLIGMKINERLSSNFVLLRLSTHMGDEVVEELHQHHFAITRMTGEGRHGNKICVCYCFMKRRLAQLAIKLAREVDPEVFVAVEPIEKTVGGYFAKNH